MSDPMTHPLLEIRNLSVSLPKGADRPFAVRDVTLEVKPAEILCIVGESGICCSCRNGSGRRSGAARSA